jgi:tetrahydromethanopterin S-methyltransferase subunit H
VGTGAGKLRGLPAPFFSLDISLLYGPIKEALMVFIIVNIVRQVYCRFRQKKKGWQSF